MFACSWGENEKTKNGKCPPPKKTKNNESKKKKRKCKDWNVKNWKTRKIENEIEIEDNEQKKIGKMKKKKKKASAVSSHPNWPHWLSQDGVLARSPPHHRPIDPSLARSWNECQLKRRGTTYSTLTESTRRTDGGLWPLWSRVSIDGRWLLRRIFEEHRRRRYLTWDDSFHSFFHWKETWIVLIVHFGQRPERKWNLFNDISEILVSLESSSVVEKSGNGSSVCLLSTTMWKFARCRSKIIVSWNYEVFFSKPRNRSQRSPKKKNSCQHIFRSAISPYNTFSERHNIYEVRQASAPQKGEQRFVGGLISCSKSGSLSRSLSRKWLNCLFVWVMLCVEGWMELRVQRPEFGGPLWKNTMFVFYFNFRPNGLELEKKAMAH